MQRQGPWITVARPPICKLQIGWLRPVLAGLRNDIHYLWEYNSLDPVYEPGYTHTYDHM